MARQTKQDRIDELEAELAAADTKASCLRLELKAAQEKISRLENYREVAIRKHRDLLSLADKERAAYSAEHRHLAELGEARFNASAVIAERLIRVVVSEISE